MLLILPYNADRVVIRRYEKAVFIEFGIISTIPQAEPSRFPNFLLKLILLIDFIASK
jgi:hypothetical protein